MFFVFVRIHVIGYLPMTVNSFHAVGCYNFINTIGLSGTLVVL